MKYAIICYVCAISFCVSACVGPFDDLRDIESTKALCKNFKLEYERVGVKKDTVLITNQIKECKDAGAWE